MYYKCIRHTNVKRLELHSFADASERAYGACIYIRSTDFKGSHYISFVCSRSRVSPVKNLSLPRLELCAALLSAQLAQKVLQSIDIKFNHVSIGQTQTLVLHGSNHVRENGPHL